MTDSALTLAGVALLGTGAGWILRGWADNISFYKDKRDRGDE
ncbi:hypothetical protein SEA_REYNAULD_83 [Rhodococcus phage Reynauld]|uniref:Uncharacterized protein n=1 Tax=Rhodococcus phage Reynauld TaxID=3062845 RepID=A0ACD4UHI4_9CAUD|nr:hypothetical protein SEA_REYNAULD_83 [Rhodococcus phage Reynauld]